MPNIGRKMHRSALSGRTLAQVERDHIVATLHATNCVLGGWNGAAAQLGLSRATLISRMPRLGIGIGALSGRNQAAPPHTECRETSPSRRGHDVIETSARLIAASR